MHKHNLLKKNKQAVKTYASVIKLNNNVLSIDDMSVGKDRSKMSEEKMAV